MIYNLVDCNDPILKTQLDNFDFHNPPCDPVQLARDLTETMIANNGLGLSANQLGLPYRVFAVNSSTVLVCYNPRLVDVSEETIYLEEGCLSFPDLFVKVKRPRRIRIRYTEPNGNTVTRVFEGLTARVMQHELDHLNGIRYTDRANRIHLEQARKKKKKIRGTISDSALQAINTLKG